MKQLSDNLIEKNIGIIVGNEEGFVSVRFLEDFTVNFPIELFQKTDINFLKYGREVSYSILVNSKGFRYQKLELLEQKTYPISEKTAKALKELESLLD